jgi:hypothetical protein
MSWIRHRVSGTRPRADWNAPVSFGGAERITGPHWIDGASGDLCRFWELPSHGI